MDTPFIRRRVPVSEKYVKNIRFTICLLSISFILTLLLLIYIILHIMLSGDVHSNPGPSITLGSRLSSASSISSHDTPDLSKNISFVHYNVQSIAQKLDVLYAELCDFDIMAFSETWLNPSVTQPDLLFHSFQPPERTECIWIELVLSTKHILFGLFYRPPNTDSMQHSRIVDSIHLAVDTGITNIVITGDFNINMANAALSRKINSLCQLFSFTQLITEHTHFTENSSSLIDIILSSNQNLIASSGVLEPFLQQNIRYHCPVYGLLNLKKTKHTSFKRNIWLFDKGNYPLLRDKVIEFDWNALKHNDLDIYSNNISSTILKISRACIPNRDVTIRQDEPPWITAAIRKSIRQRKRLYRKAKRSDRVHDWSLFRQLRNKTTSLIKEAKNSQTRKLEEELLIADKSSKSWWTTLKAFIKPFSSVSIPPLQSGDDIVSDASSKANVLNNYFRDQTLLDDTQSPPLPDLPDLRHLPMDSITISPDEVLDVLKAVPIGKACGPDAINNRILRELSAPLSTPLCDLFNASLSLSYFPESWKEANVSPLFKSGDPSVANNYRPISLLSTLVKYSKRLYVNIYITTCVNMIV